MTFLDNAVFIVLLIISIIMTLSYLLTWIMSSKNRSAWLIVALVLFGLDTLGMIFLGGISFDSILDIVFHVALSTLVLTIVPMLLSFSQDT